MGFWIVIGLALLLGVLALRGDGARADHVRKRSESPAPEGRPATVIVPVKGADHGLRENLAALAELGYPDYELIVVACREKDIPSGVVPDRARVVIAGQGEPGTGEKVNNLMAAVRAARPESEILAFADSDGRAGRGWLKALAGGLERPGAGASTGYRYYLPDPPAFWPLMRSVWNAVIAGGFDAGDADFAWGGAMAIRRETFERIGVVDHWRGSVSDDYALARAVHRAGLQVVYEPGALVVSSDAVGGGELIRWIRRQLVITRVYSPRLWGLALFGHIIYCVAMTTSTALAVQGSWIGGVTLAAQLGLAWFKGARRLKLLRLSLPEESRWFDRHGWVHVWWVPLGTWLWLVGLLASAFGNTIEWRGNRYRLSAAGPAEKL